MGIATAQTNVLQSAFSFCDDALPAGMRYRRDFINEIEECELLRFLGELPFQEARYKEWQAKRRVVSYGGRYDFSRNQLLPAEPIASFLHPLRHRVAQWSGIPATEFEYALINEYRPGTELGWHRDAPDFDWVVGISLAGSARMRLRPYPPAAGRTTEVRTIDLPPRSAYVLSGAARWNWQHAISPTKALRYSITFRTPASRRT
jgi:alkylated DNA repair dioxygenase AlkB